MKAETPYAAARAYHISHAEDEQRFHDAHLEFCPSDDERAEHEAGRLLATQLLRLLHGLEVSIAVVCQGEDGVLEGWSWEGLESQAEREAFISGVNHSDCHIGFEWPEQIELLRSHLEDIEARHPNGRGVDITALLDEIRKAVEQ